MDSLDIYQEGPIYIKLKATGKGNEGQKRAERADISALSVLSIRTCIRGVAAYNIERILSFHYYFINTLNKFICCLRQTRHENGHWPVSMGAGLDVSFENIDSWGIKRHYVSSFPSIYISLQQLNRFSRFSRRTSRRSAGNPRLPLGRA